MRLWYGLVFLWGLNRRILQGTWHVLLSAWGRKHISHPCIIEFTLECRSDLEIAAMASCITIPPGSIVVGVAAGRGDDKPSMFVHSAYNNDRDDILADLRAQEALLLRALRGRRS